MLRSIITVGLIATSAAIASSPTSAFAGSKLEKVDMVKEGIDLAPVIVKANSNGYTSYATSSHKYLLRVFAKAKGSNHVYFGGITSHKGAHPMEVGWPWFFDQQAPNGNDGWGVFKKSLKVDIGVSNTNWITSPKQVCINNLNAEMAKGKSKSSVLKKEWKLITNAVIYFVAAADSKGNNKNRKHTPSSVSVGEKGVVYQVAVTCREGIY